MWVSVFRIFTPDSFELRDQILYLFCVTALIHGNINFDKLQYYCRTYAKNGHQLFLKISPLQNIQKQRLQIIGITLSRGDANRTSKIKHLLCVVMKIPWRLLWCCRRVTGRQDHGVEARFRKRSEFSDTEKKHSHWLHQTTKTWAIQFNWGPFSVHRFTRRAL